MHDGHRWHVAVSWRAGLDGGHEGFAGLGGEQNERPLGTEQTQRGIGDGAEHRGEVPLTRQHQRQLEQPVDGALGAMGSGSRTQGVGAGAQRRCPHLVGVGHDSLSELASGPSVAGLEPCRREGQAGFGQCAGGTGRQEGRGDLGSRAREVLGHPLGCGGLGQKCPTPAALDDVAVGRRTLGGHLRQPHGIGQAPRHRKLSVAPRQVHAVRRRVQGAGHPLCALPCVLGLVEGTSGELHVTQRAQQAGREHRGQRRARCQRRLKDIDGARPPSEVGVGQGEASADLTCLHLAIEGLDGG